MLKHYLAADLEEFTNQRAGETKLGEAIATLTDLSDLKNESARFVVLGIEEDIGVRANLGKPGADKAWEEFLAAFCNIQHNGLFPTEDVIIGGSLHYPELMAQAEEAGDDLEKLRALTGGIDKEVTEVIQHIVSTGKIPIVIGGGHNNSYGNIAGSSRALKEKIAVLNIDPHADYRSLEGRHSGNGFSYAREEGFLGNYGLFGLHESYNSRQIIEDFHKAADLHYKAFDTLLNYSLAECDGQLKNLLQWLGSGPNGLEVDLDSLQNFPVSARTSSGFTVNELRLWVKTAAALATPRYLHLCEASPRQATHPAEAAMAGKTLAYLAVDFIKAYGQS